MTDINLIKMMAVTNLHHMSSLKKSVEQVLKHKNNQLKDFYMYMGYKEKALDSIIKVDKKILQSSNGQKANKLAKVENENCNSLYDLDRKEAKDNMIYRNQVVSQINNNNLPQTVKNVLMAKINKVPVSMGNTQDTLSKNLEIIAKTQILLKKYKEMFKSKKASQVASYVYAVLTNQFNKITTLDNLPLKAKGNNIFDMIADEQNEALTYNHKIKKHAHGKLSSKHLKELASQLYTPKAVQSTVGLISVTPIKLAKAQSLRDKVMYKLNQVTNAYLEGIGIIKGTMEDGYQLTTKGKDLFKNPYKYLSKCNSFLYQPTTKYVDIIEPILLSIKWVSDHPKDNKYYGIALLNNTIDINKYNQFINWSVPKINQYGDIQRDDFGNIQYHKMHIATTPMGYMLVISLLLEKIMTSKMNNYKATTDFINKLNIIDKQANKLFTSPEK